MVSVAKIRKILKFAIDLGFDDGLSLLLHKRVTLAANPADPRCVAHLPRTGAVVVGVKAAVHGGAVPSL